MLTVIDRIARETSLDWRPPSWRPRRFPGNTENPEASWILVIERSPAAARQGIARLRASIFGEQEGLLGRPEPRILQAARTAGFRLRIHADEVHDLAAPGLRRSWEPSRRSTSSRRTRPI